MINLLTDMLNAQETPAKYQAFQDTIALMATIENNQQAAEADFREVRND